MVLQPLLQVPLLLASLTIKAAAIIIIIILVQGKTVEVEEH